MPIYQSMCICVGGGGGGGSGARAAESLYTRSIVSISMDDMSDRATAVVEAAPEATRSMNRQDPCAHNRNV